MDEKPRKQPLTVYLDPAHHKRLQALADRERRSVGWITRELLVLGLTLAESDQGYFKP